MERALELALDRADRVIESAQQRPPERKYLSSGEKSLSQKLYDLYVEECKKEPEVSQHLRSNVNLLEKLVAKERVPCLVVNLYPGSEGYSLMLRGENGTDSETIRLPYEQGELLEYLDAEELPPVLVDLLEKCHFNMFHSGCVIAEIRDYRQCSDRESPGYQSRHILLRPTMQTLISDVNSITSDNHKWTQEDKLLLESQLILATAEPLCLDPSISVTCTTNRLLYNKQKMNTAPMKRNFKRYSWSSLNRQQELSHCPPPPQLRLLTSSPKSKGRKPDQQYDLKITKAGNCVDMWKQSPCNLAVPSEVDVEKYAKVGKYTQSDDSKLPVWPTYDLNDDGFEREADSQYQKTKLSVLQSLDDPFISGNIQPCLEDEDSGIQMSPCSPSTDDHSDWLMMGSKANAEHGLRQSQELIQKEARCPGKMSHSSSGSASLSYLSLGKETLSVQASVSGKGVKRRRPPTKLPSSSGTHSSGSSFTPQQATSHFKSPAPPPASEPQRPSWKSSTNPSPVSIPAPAAPPPASPSPRATPPQVTANSAGLNLISVVGSVGGAQAFVSGSDPVLSCTPAATTSAGINLSGLPSGGPLPNAVPVAAQPASQAGVSLVIKNASNLRPLTLLQLPRGSLILNTLPQQPQQLSRLTPQQPLRQPPAFGPRQPGVRGPQQGSLSLGQALPAQPAVVINLTGVGTFVQSQAAALSHVGSAQKRPQQSLPPPRFQFFPALPQQQQQIHQLRIVQLPVTATAAAGAAAGAAAAPAAQPLQRQPRETGSGQSKGTAKGAKATTPKA